MTERYRENTLEGIEYRRAVLASLAEDLDNTPEVRQVAKERLHYWNGKLKQFLREQANDYIDDVIQRGL